MNEPSASCTVIIPVHNNWEHTRDCLLSLEKNSVGQSLRVMVVDNASTDSTAAELQPLGQELFGKNFSAMRLDENKGFAKSCNLGAALAKTHLLFFLDNNNLLAPNWLPPLREELETNPALGAVAPLPLYPDNTVRNLGLAYSPKGLLPLYSHFPAGHQVVSTRRTLQAVSASALLISTGTFVRCGGFYEAYQHGLEEVDLSCRIREEGLRLAVLPASRVYRLESPLAGKEAGPNADLPLLFSRCQSRLYYDLHLHAQQDGYRMCLGPDQEMWLALPHLKEEAISAEMKKRHPEDWLAMLKTEPLWQRGYDWLATHLIKAREYTEALPLLVKQAHFFPLEENYNLGAKIASLAEDRALEKQFTKAASTAAVTALNKAALIDQARKFASDDDPLLAKIYADWLERYN